MIELRKAYGYIILVFFVILAASVCLVMFFRSVVEHQKVSAAELSGVVAQLEQVRHEYNDQMSRKDEQLANLNGRVEKLTKELAGRPLPPKPPDAPAEPLPLALGLKAAGLRPTLQVFQTPETDPTRLWVGDAQKIWTWEKEAERVPPLLERDQASQNLIAGLQEKTKVLGERVDLGDKALANCDDQNKRQLEINQIVKKQADAQKKKDKLEKFLYGTGGVGAGFLLKALLSR